MNYHHLKLLSIEKFPTLILMPPQISPYPPHLKVLIECETLGDYLKYNIDRTTHSDTVKSFLPSKKNWRRRSLLSKPSSFNNVCSFLPTKLNFWILFALYGFDLARGYKKAIMSGSCICFGQTVNQGGKNKIRSMHLNNSCLYRQQNNLGITMTWVDSWHLSLA